MRMMIIEMFILLMMDFLYLIVILLNHQYFKIFININVILMLFLFLNLIMIFDLNLFVIVRLLFPDASLNRWNSRNHNIIEPTIHHKCRLLWLWYRFYQRFQLSFLHSKITLERRTNLTNKSIYHLIKMPFII